MTKFSVLFLSFSFLFAGALFSQEAAQAPAKTCACKDCKCSAQADCGCVAGKGCTCNATQCCCPSQATSG